MLAEISITILLWLSQLFGVTPLPVEPSDTWTVTQPWKNSHSRTILTAESEQISRVCAENPESVLRFPPVIQSAQSLTLNGRPIAHLNDATFQSVNTFYGALEVPCGLLTEEGRVEWRVVSSAEYFARISHWPRIESRKGFYNFFAESLHSLVSVALMVLGLFSLIVFWKKVAWQGVTSLTVATTFLAFYFAAMTPEVFHLPGQMIHIHKLADICLWIGMAGVFAFLRTQHLFSSRMLTLFFGAIAVSVVILAIAPNGDVAQFGTTIPFLVGPIVLGSALVRNVRTLGGWRQNPRVLFAFVEIMLFISTSANDIFFVMGVLPTAPLLPVGMLGILFFAALSLESHVKEIYKERDYLQHNLEREVACKTRSLEQALSGLKCAQAELVQSAKLASLGTLSAGIAHEINNSLNYVNGSLTPLTTILKKESITTTDREKAHRLVGVMKEGLQLTAQIIANLKSYTRTGDGNKELVSAREVVEGVLVILRNKVKRGVLIYNDVPEDLKLLTEKVSLSQVLMNLVDNGVDAMENVPEEKRSLRFSGADDGTTAWLSVTDTGPGIPTSIQERIFDPFFSTKPEGKGTGLGLYIVNNEIRKQGGTVQLVSHPDQGTTFTLRLASSRKKEAA